MPEKSQAGAAIEPRGILERLGHREKRLAQQERAERARRERRDERPVAVDPAEPLQRDEVRQKRHLDGNDQRADDGKQNDAAAAKAPARQRESREARGGELQQQDRQRDHYAVEEVSSERSALPGAGEIAPFERRRQPARGRREDLVAGLECAHQQPIHRHGDERGQRQDRSINSDATQDADHRLNHRLTSAVTAYTRPNITTAIAAAKPSRKYWKPCW